MNDCEFFTSAPPQTSMHNFYMKALSINLCSLKDYFKRILYVKLTFALSLFSPPAVSSNSSLCY